MKKTILGFIAGVLVTFSATVFAQTVMFSDVKTTDWFYDDVMSIARMGVIQGYPDGTYKPSNYVNRAEFAAMLNRYDDAIDSATLFKLEEFASLNAWEHAQIVKNQKKIEKFLYDNYNYPDRPTCDAVKASLDFLKSEFNAFTGGEYDPEDLSYSVWISTLEDEYYDCLSFVGN